MFASKLSSLRPAFRAAFRHRAPSRSISQPAGRSHETLQERVATGSDRPWQLAAVAITIPGLMYLRKGIRPFHSGPGAMMRQTQPARMEARAEQPQAAPNPAAESSPREKFEAAVERTRMGSESASSSASEGEATPSSASSELGEYAESGEGAAEMQAPPGPEK